MSVTRKRGTKILNFVAVFPRLSLHLALLFFPNPVFPTLMNDI